MIFSSRAATRCLAWGTVLWACSALQGCATLFGDEAPLPAKPTAAAAEAAMAVAAAPPDAASAPVNANPAVKVEITAPGDLKALLERHLDLIRLGKLPREEVDETEWGRLIDAAPSQVRDLLQTEGYFNPKVSLERGEDVHLVKLDVEPGPEATVAKVRLQVEGELERGDAAGDARAQQLLGKLRQQWALGEGQVFRNAEWGSAKAGVLALLRSSGYASASWSGTQADVDAPSNKVSLFLVVDSGPLFRYGELEIEGLVAQQLETVRNLVAAPKGAPVTEQFLVDFQERLQKANLFENISVTLDPDPTRASQARITARLREAPLQSYTFGLGISANTGPRASVEQTYRRVFGYSALARNKFEYGQLRRAWDGELSSHAGESLYRNLISGAVEWLESDTDIVLSQRVRVGRSQEGLRNERLLYVEAERSRRTTLDQQLRTDAIAFSLNFRGIWRDLDSVILPTQGYSLNAQIGGGRSHGSDAEPGPFQRAYARLTGYQPVGRAWYSQARVEIGQVFLRSNQVVPESQQFRAGGDDSVRGYAYRSLGPLVDGAVGSGNVMYTLSGEFARPISAQMPTLWGATFIDLGNAGNSFSHLNPAIGVGVGLRWRSPVGPLRLDYAYGTETKKSRVHFSVGIAF
jgi:translocation and assembly module TamA